MKFIAWILRLCGLQFIKREYPATLTEDLVREIVAFHRSLPKHLSASIMVHPKDVAEYGAAAGLANELNMEVADDGTVRSDLGVFPTYFFKLLT